MLPKTTIDSLDSASDVAPVWVRPHPYVLAYWLIGGLLTLLLLYGYSVDLIVSWRGSAALHAGMEAIATLLAAIIGVMALARYYSRKDGIFLYIGVGFIGTSTLDGFHALVTSPYFEAMMTSNMAHLTPWSWLASRLFLSVFILLSWFGWHRIDDNGKPAQVPEKLIYLGTAAFTLFCFWVFVFVPLPPAYNGDLYFQRLQELLPASLFLLGLIAFLYKGAWKHYYFEHWLVLSLIFAVISHALFMSVSGDLFDYGFNIGHLLKIVGYLCVFNGLIASMYVTYRIEQETNLATLQKTNEKLQAELNFRKKTETRLKVREQELLRSNQELEQFAYVASHDLQEPLRKIQSFGDRLLHKYSSDLDERAIDYLQRMQRAANRMSDLINDLLDYSRIHTKVDNFDSVNLYEIFLDVLDDLEVSITETNCRIICPGLPILEADSLQMRRLFQNLVSNAIKFRDKQRPPFIRVECTVVRFPDSDNGYCEITVTDNGIGFDQENAERVFEIFGRLHARSEYEGTGIGLAVVRRIAKRHGGSAEATSVVGEGSTFTVKLKLEHFTTEVEVDD